MSNTNPTSATDNGKFARAINLIAEKGGRTIGFFVKQRLRRAPLELLVFTSSTNQN